MQINKELLEMALVEGVELSEPVLGNVNVALATEYNDSFTGFNTTGVKVSDLNWIYVCTYEEYLKAKAEKEKMQENEFKVGDLVDVTCKGVSVTRTGELKYISKQIAVISEDGKEYFFSCSGLDISHKRKTQDWFGVEIDAFMTEKPEMGEYYWFFGLRDESSTQTYSFNGDITDSKLFNMGIWDSEEKAKRSAPLMRQRLIEMAGVK